MRRYKEVTATQFREGYLELRGNPLEELAIACRRDFEFVRKTERGTYIVVDPELTNDNQDRGEP